MFEQLKYNLKHNRKNAIKVATAWFLFGAIIIVFAFMGLAPDPGALGGAGTAASVNGKGISVAKFVNMMDRLREDPNFARQNAGQQMLEQQAISQLVEIELVNQAADGLHIWSSDAEVRDVITQIPAFQEKGRFKRELYMGYLNSVRQSPADFEADIRSEMSLRRASKLFSAALRPMDAEAERTKELSAIRTNVEFASVPTERLIAPQSVNPQELQAFLGQPENQAKVKQYFESRRSEFQKPEQVKARHILIQADGTNPEADKKAFAKILEIAEKAKKEDFAKLASQFSEDPGSKDKGGMLDFFSRGMMVPEFEQAAFSAALNTITAPVKTQFGYHLIQVVEKSPATEPALSDVEKEIAGILIAQDRSRAALDELQANLKSGNEAAVREFVSKYALKWDESGPFSLDSQFIPKIGQNDEIMRLAFTLTAEKPLATGLVRDGSRAFIVRHKPTSAMKDEKPPGADFMAEMMAGRRGQDAMGAWVKMLREQAKISVNPSVVNNR